MGIVLLISLAAAPTIHIASDAPFARDFAFRLLDEVPDLRIVDRPTAGALTIRFAREGDRYALVLDGVDANRRDVGSIHEPHALVRIAVLLIAGHLSAQPPPPPPPVHARARRPTWRLLLSGADPPYFGHPWRVEASAVVAAEAQSATPLVGVSAAVYRRLSRWARIGTRAQLIGLCCAADIGRVQVEGWLGAGLVEGGAEHVLGPVSLDATVGVGIYGERLDVRVANTAASMTSTRFGPVLRASAGLDVALWRDFALLVRGGVLLRGASHDVRPDEVAQPVGRGRAFPLSEVGLTGTF